MRRSKQRILHLGERRCLSTAFSSMPEELPGLFIVSRGRTGERLLPETSQVTVTRSNRAKDKKCERCWKYTNDVGSETLSTRQLCAACSEAVRGIILES